MKFSRICSAIWLLIALILLPIAAHAEIGTAVDVDPSARVGSATLVSGARLSAGDVIQTSGQGQAQILFDDNTRIVVGPNSRFVISDIQMGSSNSANRFAVDAVRGSFRFISGRSPKNAFRISTPHATIGVRGTIFDLNVAGQTQLASLRGIVEMCGSSACVTLRARCSVAIAERGGSVRTPTSVSEAGQIIRSGFPYIEDQRPRLLPAFRSPVRSCARYEVPRRGIGQNEEGGRFETERDDPEEPDEDRGDEGDDEDDGGDDDGGDDDYFDY
ncbi:MAG: FecR domain-containing protein [Pseudomonadota bacterium]